VTVPAQIGNLRFKPMSLRYAPVTLLIALAPQLGCSPAVDAPASPKSAPAAAPAAGVAPPAPTASAADAPPASAPPVASSAPAPSGSAASASPDATPHIDEDNVYGPHELGGTPGFPSLHDESGKPLPQTPDRPTTKSAAFGARMALLGQAISSGNADTALPAFFPSVAYAQVKDIPDPERDWDQRLVSAFRRDVAAYRQKLGKDAAGSTLVSVDVPEQSARFMKPGSEGNRVGYYRVLRSALHFRLAGGKERTLELTSMISWRGEWYVVHLNGFK
jgi:hypothetical protein